MQERKSYPVGVALSVASGKLLCEFPALHDAVTDLAGWPVFTHHMGNETLMSAVAAKVIGQVSWMPGAIENMPTWSDLPRDEVWPAIEAWLDGIGAAHGDTVTLDLGEEVAYMSPFDGFERLGSGL